MISILFQVLIALLPQSQMQSFDVQTKTWKFLPSMAKLSEATACFCAEYVGNCMYVAAKRENDFVNYRYHTVKNTWEILPSFVGLTNQISCFCSVDDHLYAIYQSQTPYRYHIPTNQWQCVAKSSVQSNMPQSFFGNRAAVVYKSCVYVLRGQGIQIWCGTDRYGLNTYFWEPKAADVFCFDPKRNVWEQKASTSTKHFGSSLLVVNDKLYVAGGKCSISSSNGEPCGGTGCVEVYDEENNTRSVVDQPHIPRNNLGAIEVEGRVYFIINNFPVDSGIRIPPGELYPVCLDEWENLGKMAKNAVLCHVPVNRKNLTSE